MKEIAKKREGSTVSQERKQMQDATAKREKTTWQNLFGWREKGEESLFDREKKKGGLPEESDGTAVWHQGRRARNGVPSEHPPPGEKKVTGHHNAGMKKKQIHLCKGGEKRNDVTASVNVAEGGVSRDKIESRKKEEKKSGDPLSQGKGDNRITNSALKKRIRKRGKKGERKKEA